MKSQLIEDEILCFCRAQVLCIQGLAKFHLLLPTNTYGLYHPITNNLECIIHEFKTRSFISKGIHIIFKILINEEAKGRIDRLLACGYIKPQSI